MTEQDYVDATNLAKARMAQTIMRDYLDLDKPYDKHAQAARAALVRPQFEHGFWWWYDANRHGWFVGCAPAFGKPSWAA